MKIHSITFYGIVALGAFLFYQIPLISYAQSKCGTPVECYEKAVKQLQTARNEMESTKHQISELKTEVTNLKRQIVPIGTIVSFAAGKNANIPENWLVCNGDLIDKNKYQALWNIIGTTWGDHKGNKFRLPDLRGQFIRGYSGTSSIDPDNNERSALYEGGNTKNRVGSYQDYATSLPKSRPFKTSNPDPGVIQANTYRPWDESPSSFGRGKTEPRKGSISIPHTHNVDKGGDKETRPKNVYVLFIIRAY